MPKIPFIKIKAKNHFDITFKLNKPMKKSFWFIRLTLIIATAALIPLGLKAAVPDTNRMQLGEISSILPVEAIKNHFAKMEPLMRKYFGPPFSNVTIKIEADPTGTVHNTGYLQNEATLVLAGQAKRYVEDKQRDPNGAIKQIESNLRHELAHGMYYLGNNRVELSPQWISEGWVKVLEELQNSDLGEQTMGYWPYFSLYRDQKIVAGTPNWGSSKQNTNHGVVYEITSAVHFTLLSAASSSLTDLDFLKKLNAKIYDLAKIQGQTRITFAQYQKIMKELLANTKIDGQPAYDWYFNNPDAYIKGQTGNFLGVTVDRNEIIAYAFKRQNDGRDITESGLKDISVTISIIDAGGKTVAEQKITTDQDGNAIMTLPELNRYEVYSIAAQAIINNQEKTDKTFYFNAASSYDLYIVLMDETGHLLPASYITLLNPDAGTIAARDKGLLVLKTSPEARQVNFDFLGFKQEVTKGYFARLVAIKIPQKYLDAAAQKTKTELTAGLVTPPKNFNHGLSDLFGFPIKASAGQNFSQFLNQKPWAWISLIIGLVIAAVYGYWFAKNKK